MHRTALARMTPTGAGFAVGPRNKRRLTAGAISFGVIAVIAAALFLILRPSSHPASASSSSTHVSARPLVTQKIVYGMTKAEVLRRIGKPVKTAGACWQYTENKSIWDGQHIINAERVCFLSGIYSYDYSKMDGEWNYPTTPLTVPKNLG